MRGVVQFQGKSQQAYNELKRRILMLEMQPGQMLQEADLMEVLGCGRTPVREAIKQLAAEKLVIARPRQSAFIAPILAQELAEIGEMRSILEVPAARMAAKRGTAVQRKRLQSACETFRKRARADDRNGILVGDAAIHALIASMSRNSFLLDSSERVAGFSQRVWWLSVQHASRDEGFIRCHDELIDAICAGNPQAAANAAEEHVAMFQTRLEHLVQPGGVAPAPPGEQKNSKRSDAAA